MGDTRNGVAPGWLGFWNMRVEPQGDYEPRRHGNWKHGEYAKETIQNFRALKLAVRSLRTGQTSSARPCAPPGWRLFPYVRREVSPPRDGSLKPHARGQYMPFVS